MHFTLLTMGRTDVGWIRKGLEDYVARLGHYVPFTLTELPELRGVSSLTEAQVRAKEGDAILKAVKSRDYLVLLDEHGAERRSMDFSSWLEDRMMKGQDLTFVIGGAYGFSEAVYERASEKISLSKMTFSHQMVRVIFAEQLYRAFSIMRGEPYHHE